MSEDVGVGGETRGSTHPSPITSHRPRPSSVFASAGAKSATMLAPSFALGSVPKCLSRKVASAPRTWWPAWPPSSSSTEAPCNSLWESTMPLPTRMWRTLVSSFKPPSTTTPSTALGDCISLKLPPVLRLGCRPCPNGFATPRPRARHAVHPVWLSPRPLLQQCSSLPVRRGSHSPTQCGGPGVSRTGPTSSTHRQMRHASFSSAQTPTGFPSAPASTTPPSFRSSTRRFDPGRLGFRGHVLSPPSLQKPRSGRGAKSEPDAIRTASVSRGGFLTVTPAGVPTAHVLWSLRSPGDSAPPLTVLLVKSTSTWLSTSLRHFTVTRCVPFCEVFGWLLRGTLLFHRRRTTGCLCSRCSVLFFRLVSDPARVS